MQFCTYTYTNYHQLLKLIVFLWSWYVKYFRTHVAITARNRIVMKSSFSLNSRIGYYNEATRVICRGKCEIRVTSPTAQSSNRSALPSRRGDHDLGRLKLI